MRFNKVAIIGTGLIGGSVGLALRKKHLAKTIVGFGHRAQSLKIAKARGAVDNWTLDLEKAAAGADLIVICTPAGMIARFAIAAARANRACVIVDAGSTKAEIVRKVRHPRFVGSHPMAGSEQRGITAARTDLFKNSVTILTPTRRTSGTALKTAQSFWKALGCRTVILSPEKHDQLISQISHLPHLAAVALVNTASGRALRFAAGGFRDMTRIATSDPVLWRDICLTNKKAIVRDIARFEKILRQLKRAVAASDQRSLIRAFKNAKAKRDKI